MTYDLAVWEGDRPASDELAGAAFEELCERYLESVGPRSATVPMPLARH